MSFRRLSPFAYGLVAVAAAAAVYLPVTRGYFFADDFVWLLHFRDWPMLRALTFPFGGHALLLRNVVFYASWSLFGLWPEPYHWTLFLTHLANVGLLFVLLRRLTGSVHLACLGGLLWGTSPLCAGTVAWYSVYGHALVGTILLVVLCQVVRVREPSLRDGVGWFLLLLAGVLCFGVGVGIGMTFPATLFLLRPEAWRHRLLRVLFLLLPVAIVGLYFGYRRVAAAIAPFTFAEQYIVAQAAAPPWAGLAMVGHLLGVGTAGLLLGIFSAPLVYPGGAARAALIAAGVGVVLALLIGDARGRRQLLASLVLALGGYGTIALGRANFYAAAHWALPAAARQPRYHYAAMLPVTMAVCVLLQQLTRWRPLRLLVPLVVPLWLVGATMAFVTTPWRVEGGDTARVAVADVRHGIDALIDATPPGAPVSIPNLPLNQAVLGAALAPADFPGWAGLFALFYPADVVRGHRVVFVERDARLLAAVRAGDDPRLAALLVSRAAAPGGTP